MSPETGPSGETLSAQIEEAERRLRAAAEVATTAERRATAEIEALEADLERERAGAEQTSEKLRLAHEEELQREREAKEKAGDVAGLGRHQGLPRPVRVSRLHQALPQFAVRDGCQASHRGAGAEA